MASYSFTDLAQRDQQLAKLLTEARALLALDTAFRQLLPTALRDQCRAVRIRDGELVLSAANGTAAARLRMLATALLPTLAKQGYAATRVKVQVNIYYTLPRRQKTAHISPRALDDIEAARVTIRDPGVREALARLVQRHKR